MFCCALVAADIFLSMAGYARGDIVTVGISGYVTGITGQQNALPVTVNFNDKISGSYIYGTVDF